MAASACSEINCEPSASMNGRLSTVGHIIQDLDAVGANQSRRCTNLNQQTTVPDRRSLEAERRRLRRSLETPEERQQRLDKQRQRQRNFISRETSLQRHQRLIKDAARHRMKREMETFEERFMRQNQDSARHIERRSSETTEERQQRLEKERQRQCNHRSRETSLQRHQRLTKDAARHRIKREFETFEERFRRQSQDSARHKERRSRETPEERQQRLDKQRERQQNVISRETSLERQQRLDKERQRQCEVRRRETWLQRHQRLTKDAARHRMKREMETFEERFMRQNQESARQNERRSRETSEERQYRRARDALSHRNRRNRNKSQVSFCCVPGCTSQSIVATGQQTMTSNGCNLSLHEIPANDELRAKWLQAISMRAANGISDTSRVVCSEHFRPTDYIKLEMASGRCLMPAAVPSVFACPMHFGCERRPTEPQQQVETSANAMNLKRAEQWPITESTETPAASCTRPSDVEVEVLVDGNFERSKRVRTASDVRDGNHQKFTSDKLRLKGGCTVSSTSADKVKHAGGDDVQVQPADDDLKRLRKDYAEIAKELHDAEAQYSSCRIRLFSYQQAMKEVGNVDDSDAALRSAKEDEKSAAFLVEQLRNYDDKNKRVENCWPTAENTVKSCAVWREASRDEYNSCVSRSNTVTIARLPSPKTVYHREDGDGTRQNKEGAADWSLLVTQHLQEEEEMATHQTGASKEERAVTSLQVTLMGQ